MASCRVGSGSCDVALQSYTQFTFRRRGAGWGLVEMGQLDRLMSQAEDSRADRAAKQRTSDPHRPHLLRHALLLASAGLALLALPPPDPACMAGRRGAAHRILETGNPVAISGSAHSWRIVRHCRHTEDELRQNRRPSSPCLLLLLPAQLRRKRWAAAHGGCAGRVGNGGGAGAHPSTQ